MTVVINGDTGITQAGEFNSDSTMGFKNRIINGAMVIDQRNAGAAVTASGAFPVDRFQVNNNTDGAFSAQQDSSAPPGFVNSLKITTTTADGTLTTTQQLNVLQYIEGTNVSDLAWGTANAKTVTVSFWVRSSLTGTFGGALRNSAANRSYPFTYAISVADTWEYKTVEIEGDTTGTWLTNTGIGVSLVFGLGIGPDRSGTAGAWAAATYSSATGAVSVIGTLNATWYVTGVQLEVGTVATSFDFRSYGTELALCQRYFQKDFQGSLGQAYSTTDGILTLHCAVPMRASPSLTQASGVNITIDIIGGNQNASSQGISGAGQSPTKTTITVAGLTGRTTNQPLAISNTGTQLSAEL